MKILITNSKPSFNFLLPSSMSRVSIQKHQALSIQTASEHVGSSLERKTVHSLRVRTNSIHKFDRRLTIRLVLM